MRQRAQYSDHWKNRLKIGILSIMKNEIAGEQSRASGFLAGASARFLSENIRFSLFGSVNSSALGWIRECPC